MGNFVCYITQSSGQNFSSLLKLTDNIVVVASKDYPLFGDATDHINKVKQAIKHFDIKKDMIVPAGDPINIAIVFHELLKKGGELCCMKWDRQNNMYVPVKIKLDDGGPVDKKPDDINEKENDNEKGD